jgi:hypothetical protein
MAEQTTETVASETTSQETQTQEQQTSQAANTTDSATGQETQATETTETKGPEPKPLGDKGVDELITQRRKRQDAERQAAYWRGIAEGARGQGQQQQTQQPPASQGPPTIDQFENYDDFVSAKAEYNVMQKIQQQSRQSIQQNAQATINNGWNERLAKAREKFPDIDDAIERIGYHVSEPMAWIIKASNKGPELTRYLDLNPGEVTRIAQLNPILAAQEIGRLEAQITANPAIKPNKISQAPEPIKNLSATGSVANVDFEKMSMDDYMKRRNEEAKARR